MLAGRRSGRLTSMHGRIVAAMILTACSPEVHRTYDSQPTADGGSSLPVLSTIQCVAAGVGEKDAGAAAFQLDACARTVDGGTEAVFEWTNSLPDPTTVPFGPTNQVTPGTQARGQPETFLGADTGRFVVVYTGPSVSWTLLDQSVTASLSTKTCDQECVGSGLAGPDSYYFDTCTIACGDGRCDEERCSSCPDDCDCASIEPILDCVSVTADGKHQASFGYRNTSPHGGGIAFGPQNAFSPGEAVRSQPAFFPPGEYHDVFAVTYEEPDLTWTLGTRSVKATPDTPACAGTCTNCAPGILCLRDKCISSCGDGYCLEGDCLRCPADCGCTSGNICFYGPCATPPKCGFSAECGTQVQFGVHIECGPCKDGWACVSNVCRPVCDSGGS
jgi:hypothetical protein